MVRWQERLISDLSVILVIRNYEEYPSINDKPGFSFIPPVINEEVSFNISSQTLISEEDNYFYDVDSGSYSQIRFACGFKNGDDNDLTSFSLLFLNIRQCK